MPKTVNIPAFAAESIEDLTGWVLISVHDQHEAPYNLKVADDQVLRVTFSDVTSEVLRGELWFNTIRVEQAHEILAFIEKHKEKNIVVNCRAGVSRSAAICLFIHLFYGHELKEHFYQVSNPNPYVLGMLTREYHIKYKS
jgi:predicted protein tyrosine phosphatase